jgi:hypothetical protein
VRLRPELRFKDARQNLPLVSLFMMRVRGKTFHGVKNSLAAAKGKGERGDAWRLYFRLFIRTHLIKAKDRNHAPHTKRHETNSVCFRVVSCEARGFAFPAFTCCDFG